MMDNEIGETDAGTEALCRSHSVTCGIHHGNISKHHSVERGDSETADTHPYTEHFAQALFNTRAGIILHGRERQPHIEGCHKHHCEQQNSHYNKPEASVYASNHNAKLQHFPKNPPSGTEDFKRSRKGAACLPGAAGSGLPCLLSKFAKFAKFAHASCEILAPKFCQFKKTSYLCRRKAEI